MKIKDLIESVEYSDRFTTDEFADYIEKNHPDGIVPEHIQQDLVDWAQLNMEIVRMIKNPTLNLQRYVLRFDNIYLIPDIQNIDKDILKNILVTATNVYWVNKDSYEWFVRTIFKDNQILMNKWLKYGETIRNEI